MSTPTRLPIVNSDDGTWGDIIRQYLMKEHYDDGTDNPTSNGGHQNVTIRAGTATKAPLTFTSGVSLTTPAPGAMEFNTDSLYFTITTGSVRKKVAIYDDSSGATGDTYYRDASGNFVRLGIGTTGQTLRVSGSSIPAWQSSSGGFTTATKGSNYTIGANDTVIFANAGTSSITITLPSATGMAGYRFYVKRVDSSATNTCTIAAADNIDGVASFTIDHQYTSVALVCDGSTWYIL